MARFAIAVLKRPNKIYADVGQPLEQVRRVGHVAKRPRRVKYQKRELYVLEPELWV